MTTNTQTTAKDIECTINANSIGNGTLTLTFRDGRMLQLDGADLNGELQRMAMMHGLKQKLVDAAAISRNPDTGRSATIEDKYNAVREVYDRLLAGQWNKGRDGGGSTKGGLLFRALCILYADKSPEAIKAYLDGKSKAEQAALRATKKIADVIDTLRAEGSNDDGDALLDELNDL